MDNDVFALDTLKAYFGVERNAPYETLRPLPHLCNFRMSGIDN